MQCFDHYSIWRIVLELRFSSLNGSFQISEAETYLPATCKQCQHIHHRIKQVSMRGMIDSCAALHPNQKSLF